MADQPSIFNTENSEATPPNNDPSKVTDLQATELTDLLGSIKNERGEPKYKTLKDAIIGLQHAQTYIPELKTSLTAKESELQAAREKAARVAELEETVRNLTQSQRSTDTPTAGLSKEEIADLVSKSVDSSLTQRQQAEKASQNVQSVVSSLQAAFGADAEAKFKQAAADAGMSVAEFNQLAAKSPQIILTALGVKPKAPQSFSPTQSSVNSQALQPSSDTFIRRNDKSTQVGATTEEVKVESDNSKKMVEELHAQGLTVHDLSNPKVYQKYFGKT
jgi:hypothetical protein